MNPKFSRKKNRKTIHPYYKKEEFEQLPLGEKKRAFVAWLMRKGVPLSEATLICSRKFYHGDPFEK